jgi:hypothetical protein
MRHPFEKIHLGHSLCTLTLRGGSSGRFAPSQANGSADKFRLLTLLDGLRTKRDTPEFGSDLRNPSVTSDR